MTIHCINLYNRPEKWEQAKQELSRIGEPIRWPALQINPGWEGCKRSHYALLKYLHEYSNEKLYGVFEDDVEFTHPELIDVCLKELPKDWAMLYLGGTPNKPLEKHSEHLYRAKKTWTTHAIIYNADSKVIPFILDNLLDQERIDVFFADVVQEHFNCYIASPMIATQKNGYSDIRQKNVRTGDYIKQHYDKFVG